MTQVSLIPDADLLRDYAHSRSADAFAELVARYGMLVYGVAMRSTGRHEDAQDVAQECFLQLAAKSSDIAQPLPAWLHTLARSRSIDAVRRRAARQRHERQSAGPETAPLSLDEWNTLCEQMDAAIEMLPEELRIPLIGQYLQGQTQQELAQLLGVNQATISRRIERAVQQLRDDLVGAGLSVPLATMGTVLSEFTGQGALPAGLAGRLARIGLSGIGPASARRKTKRSRVAIAAAALLAAGAAIAWWAAPHPKPQQGNSGATAMTTQPVRQTSVPLRRENGKVWIDGIRPGARNTNPYAQGLAVLLEHLGHKDAGYIRVMGYSGVAFALQMDIRGPIQNDSYDVAWWPNDCYAFDLRVDFLSRAFGRELRKIDGTPAFQAGPRQEYEARFESAIIDAIDHGYPILAQQTSAYLITGYDLPNHKPIGIWPSPGQPAFGPALDGYPWGLLIPGKAIEPLAQNQAEIQSLRWAVALWDDAAAATIKGRDMSWLLTGSKAYAKWLELLQGQAENKGLGRDSWDVNMIIHLRYNRTAAVAYLRDLANRQAPTPAAHLRSAADLYQQELDAIARAPFYGQFEDNPEIRPQKLQEYTDIVRHASELEAQAINEIRQAIADGSAAH